MKYLRHITKLLIVILPFFAVYLSIPTNTIITVPKACAVADNGYFSQWGPNCPGADANHHYCPSGAAYPSNYPACIDSVGIDVPIVVTGLTGNNGSIKIKAHAKGPGSSGWDNACVAENVLCLLREADSETISVSTNNTYTLFIDPIGCTSGNCDDNFSITAQVDTSGTQYTCTRTDDRTENLNKNGQHYTTAPVGIICSLPIQTVCHSSCNTSLQNCIANGKEYHPTVKTCVGASGTTSVTECGTPPDSGTCEIPKATPTNAPTPTRPPTPTPTRPAGPTPTPTTPPPSTCPVPSAVTNVKISCPSCGL